MVKKYQRKGGHGGSRANAGLPKGYWEEKGGRAAAKVAKAAKTAAKAADVKALEQKRKERWTTWAKPAQQQQQQSAGEQEVAEEQQ